MPIPALKAVSPQAPIADWFVGDDWHHNGALMLPHAFNFMAVFGRPRPSRPRSRDSRSITTRPTATISSCRWGRWPTPTRKYFKGDVPFWNEVMQHGTYDEFWKARNLRPHLKNIKPAVMTVGGWFDAEDLFGALETYKHVEAQQPGAEPAGDGALVPRRLVPRRRATRLGDVSFNAKTADFYREKIELPFFEFYLKGKGPSSIPRPGSSRPARTMAAIRRLAAQGGPAEVALPARRRQARLRPAGRRRPEAGYDEYVSDPAKPVPYHRQDRHRHAPRIHGRGPAVRRDAARRAGLPDRGAGGRPDASPGRSRSNCSSPPRAPTPTGLSS